MINTLLPTALSLSALLGSVTFAAVQINSSSESYVERAKIQNLATWCESGMEHACKALAKATDGQCASPTYKGGCRFDSNTYVQTYSLKAFH